MISMKVYVDTFKSWCERLRRESVAGHIRSLDGYTYSTDRDLSATVFFTVGTVEVQLFAWETGIAEAHWVDVSWMNDVRVENRFCTGPDDLIDFLDKVTEDLVRL